MSDLASQLGGAGGPASPISRSATVQASPAPNAATAWVKFVDSQPAIELPYLAGYVPVAGDVVAVAFMSGDASMQGMILGAKATTAGNLVANSNFYRAPTLVFPPVNAPPYHWFRYVTSGTPSLFCQVMRLSAMRFIGNISAPGGGALSDTTAYSSPIPVKAGAQYYATTSGHSSVFVNTALTVQSRVAWFSDSTTDYPGFISESQFGSDSLGASSETEIYHFGTVTAPASATHARMVMRQNWTGTAPGGNMMWAEVVLVPV